MRRVALFLLAASLFVTPAAAQDSTKSRNFGRATCSSVMACPSQMGSENLRAILPSLAQKANLCIQRFFGVKTPGGFFKETTYLSSGDCLPTPPNLKQNGKIRLVPKCCFTPTDSSRKVCALVCDLNLTQ